jgi:hypothetical protein
MLRFAKPLYGQKLYRGFESPPLRHSSDRKPLSGLYLLLTDLPFVRVENKAENSFRTLLYFLDFLDDAMDWESFRMAATASGLAVLM